MQIDEIMEIIHDAELEDKYEMVSIKELDLNKQLLKVSEHYWSRKTPYFKKCAATAQQLLMTILADEELKEIHSARYRTKSIESLIIKYIKKKALLPDKQGNDYNIEKYRPMNIDNYYKIITDLIGIRILIRYQQQWEVIHNWIWGNFFKVNKSYIKNWIEDYPSGDTEDFLVEKPILYLRDEKDLPMYQKFGKDIFDWHISNEGYSSIHYLLWYDGKYVEVQVRTIYDEAWGECTHDLVYKCKHKAKRVELERLSECLATQTQAAGMISDMMFEKSKVEQKKKEKNDLTLKQNSGMDKAKFDKLEKRIQNIKNSQKQTEEFDGAIDNLI
jgi:ppGpp synthetase/RelA/SpoT-type nucleotidyltranferase